MVDILGPVVGLFGGIMLILLFCVEIIVVILVILTLWRLYVALGIYIREHEPEDHADDDVEGDEGPKGQE